MWILVASTFRPSEQLGQEDLSGELETAFHDHGHEVDSIRIPFDRDPNALISQLFAFRMTNVSDVGDLLVATGTPCHLLRHRRKVLWLTEHYPWLDDESPELRFLMAADRQAIGEARAAFAGSEHVSERVVRSTGSAVEVLPPPPRSSWARVVAALTANDRCPRGR